jgi:hypothetical protein
MEPVHLGVTTHGATLTHALVMLRRHNPRTLLVNRMPTPTQLVAVWMNLLQQLEDQSLPRVKQESLVAHAMIRNLEMTAGTILIAQIISAQVGLAQKQSPVGHIVCRPLYPDRPRRIHQHTEPCARNISSREVLRASNKLPTWSWQIQTVQLGVTTNGAMSTLAIVTAL